ncbi:MAG: protein kinase [Myxococcota bacterium]|nr:protein kinase [Myxococcota bacterium]
MEDDELPTRAEPFTGDAAAQDAPLEPGTEVHGYVIDGEIGKGGMGFVYSATHPLIGKRAAIKVLKPEVSKSPVIVERFIQEARAVNQIGHPHIIDIFAFGILPDGRAYHVMDLLVGETLRKRLRRGPMHPSEAASVIEETSQALSAAHDKGFVHRDLKPDNIFLVHQEDQWPEVRLLDFGLAKLMPEAGIAPFTTRTGVMLGTPEYMSPEQARGIGVDYRTDVYALGVVTFEILAGHRPFPSTGDAFATLQCHAEEPPPSLRDLVSGLPDELVQLVDAMLAKEPAARPSLPAVRAVIKRLRTTQLPTRTAAGLEISSFQGTSRPPPVSREPLHDPDDTSRSSQMRTPPQRPPAVMRHPSVPPLSQGDSRASQPHLAAPQSTRQPSQPPAKSTHGGGRSTGPSQSLRTSASGLAQPHVPLSKTKLGVAPAAARVSGPQPASTSPPARSHLWLIVGALLAIGAGVVLALVLVG